MVVSIMGLVWAQISAVVRMVMKDSIVEQHFVDICNPVTTTIVRLHFVEQQEINAYGKRKVETANEKRQLCSRQ